MKLPAIYGAVALLGLVAWSGCGVDNPQNRQKVSGSVKLDGQPLEKGDIMFVPVKSGPTMSGVQIANGAYTLGIENGLAPGEYSVSITAPDPSYVPKPGPGGGPPRRAPELVPPEYNTASTQKVTVQEGAANVFDFDIPAKKK